jgi:hypothetical protein
MNPMKKLLLATAICSALLSESVLAKAKGAKGAVGCAQAVATASVQTLQGAVILAAVVVTGVWIVGLLSASRRKDKELAKFKGDPKSSTTGIFSRP